MDTLTKLTPKRDSGSYYNRGGASELDLRIRLQGRDMFMWTCYGYIVDVFLRGMYQVRGSAYRAVENAIVRAGGHGRWID